MKKSRFIERTLKIASIIILILFQLTTSLIQCQNILPLTTYPQARIDGVLINDQMFRDYAKLAKTKQDTEEQIQDCDLIFINNKRLILKLDSITMMSSYNQRMNEIQVIAQSKRINECEDLITTGVKDINNANKEIKAVNRKLKLQKLMNRGRSILEIIFVSSLIYLIT